MVAHMINDPQLALKVSRSERVWIGVAIVSILLGISAGLLAYILDPRVMVPLTIAFLSIGGAVAFVGIYRSERAGSDTSHTV